MTENDFYATCRVDRRPERPRARRRDRPMSDQTPRIPDLWHDPGTRHLYTYDDDLCLIYLDDRDDKQPADAVKLGDVEALLADIRAVFDGYESGELKDKLQAFDRIRVILERTGTDE